MQVEVKEKPERGSSGLISRVLIIVAAVVLFLLAINLISYSFLHIRQQIGTTILSVADNPFIGLFIGLLLTAVIQSSSTSTAMIVALVGSGAMSLSSAVPIVMGANVGTTLTSTLVSLNYIAKKREFRKAIAAATVHDFYNIILVAILFPLEYRYGLLSRLSADLVVWLADHGRLDLSLAVPFGRGVLEGVGQWLASVINNDWLLLLLSFALLFATIKLISRFVSSSLIGNDRKRLKQRIFQSPYRAFAWGGILTAAVQSSSITTSLIVPLVAMGKVSLPKAFPFVMGANMGTTVTALVATLFSTQAALELAVVHFLFNLFGALLFLPYPPVRRWPERLAATFGKLTLQHRIYGFVYIILLFFAIPFLLIYCYRQGVL